MTSMTGASRGAQRAQDVDAGAGAGRDAAPRRPPRPARARIGRRSPTPPANDGATPRNGGATKRGGLLALSGAALLLSGCTANWGWYVVNPATASGAANLRFLLGGLYYTVLLSATAILISVALAC